MTLLCDPRRIRSVFAFMVVIFLFGGIVPVFSQEILATYGLGTERIDIDPEYTEYHWNFSEWRPETYKGAATKGMLQGVNVLFVGKSGFTVSFGTEMMTDFEHGISMDTVFGLGYIHYNIFFLGGIFNIIPKLNIAYPEGDGGHGDMDGFIVPTLVGGIDFRSFLLEGQLSYMKGVMSGANGFRFLLGVGVNAGKGW